MAGENGNPWEMWRTVLANPSYRTRAERVRDEIAAMPNLDDAVELLERLVRDNAPIIVAP